MESQGPAPVIFKSLGSTFSASEDIVCNNVKMTHFSVGHLTSSDGNDYFLLTDLSDPSHPLKLYKKALKKLINILPFAIKEAARLEEDELPDNETFDAGIINSYKNMTVRLVLTTFQKQVYIWLRLYTTDEQGHDLPTKTAVRFSKDDNVAALEALLK